MRKDITGMELSTPSFTGPTQLEPVGLSRSDGKWPDGMTVVPWSHGQLLVWDVTCPDTLATSYQDPTTHQQQGKLQQLQRRGRSTNIPLCACCHRDPSVLGPKTLAFVRVLGRKICQETGEGMATSYTSCSACLWPFREGMRLKCWGYACISELILINYEGLLLVLFCYI